MKLSIYYLLALILFTNCTPNGYLASPPECKPSPQFAQIEDSQGNQYQKIALNELKNTTPEDYYYFFKTFIEEGEQVYMMTNFRNEKNCFDVKMLVNNWEKLEGMRKTNGKSYPKQLVNLTWTIDQNGENEQVVFVDMNTIID
ncbi:MAG: hypothetical protein R3B93_15780 [Bacteroidia bacterium]